MNDDIKKAALDEVKELQVKEARIKESIERDQFKQEQLKAQLRKLKAKKSSDKRKLDAHQKIVVGATIMAAFKELDLTDKGTLERFVGYLISQREPIVMAVNKEQFNQPKQEQETKPFHPRGSLAEILGED